MTDESAPPSDMPPELGLPIEHLFMVDPLDLTVEDLTLIIQHYRNARLNFIKLADKPKTVSKSRGPALDPAATQAKVDSLLANLVGSGKPKPSPAKFAPEPDTVVNPVEPEEVEQGWEGPADDE